LGTISQPHLILHLHHLVVEAEGKAEGKAEEKVEERAEKMAEEDHHYPRRRWTTAVRIAITMAKQCRSLSLNRLRAPPPVL
jgi:hypothetical protein